MRPQYEVAADVKREDRVANLLAASLGCRLVKLSGQYARMDRMALWPDKSHAWVEIKCRNVRSDAYGTLMLSAAKWREGTDMARASGGHFILVAGYTDKVRAYVFDPTHLIDRKVWVEFGGRTAQTRDAGDIEPVVHIPTALFVDVT